MNAKTFRISLLGAMAAALTACGGGGHRRTHARLSIGTRRTPPFPW